MGFIPGLRPLYVEFTCSPCVCMGSLQNLQLPPQSKNIQVRWIRNSKVCVCEEQMDLCLCLSLATSPGCQPGCHLSLSAGTSGFRRCMDRPMASFSKFESVQSNFPFTHIYKVGLHISARLLTRAQSRSTASSTSSWWPILATPSSSRSWCVIFSSCSPLIFSRSKLPTYCWRLSSKPWRQKRKKKNYDVMWANRSDTQWSHSPASHGLTVNNTVPQSKEKEREK